MAKKLPLDYSKARAALAARVPVPDKYSESKWLKQLRGLAFTVSGIEEARVLAAVINSMDEAMEKGSSFATWRDNLAPAEVEDFQDHRLETIFRTNMQSAYNMGTLDAAQDIKETHPYLLYSAIIDDATRPTHAARDGVILPVDHPFWDKNTPPIDYNCRCEIIPIDQDEADSRGGRSTTKEVDRLSSDNPLPKAWNYEKRNLGRKLNRILKEATAELPTALRKEFEQYMAKRDSVADAWYAENKSKFSKEAK